MQRNHFNENFSVFILRRPKKMLIDRVNRKIAVIMAHFEVITVVMSMF